MSSGTDDARKDLLELDDPSHPSDRTDDEANAPPTPTLIPAFDPLQYAEEFESRERMPTLTDASVLEALEVARLKSFPTNAPPPRRANSTAPPTAPPPRRGGSIPDSTVEIDVGEDDMDALGPEEQVAILRSNLAPLSRVPALAQELSELGGALADPQTAYVIGFVDGILPLDTIIDVTGLPELETLRVLDRLVAQGFVIFRPSRVR